eukprot:5583069-Pyramimonas_sp.AAC.1
MIHKSSPCFSSKNEHPLIEGHARLKLKPALGMLPRDPWHTPWNMTTQASFSQPLAEGGGGTGEGFLEAPLLLRGRVPYLKM